MTGTNVAAIQTTLDVWAKTAVDEFDAKAVFLFGSLIYKDGAQFIDSSDVDLVVLMPDGLASQRHRWLQRFFECKEQLEFQLLRVLQRSAMEPIVSVVAVTAAELAFDIHKDGHREFFTANTFRDLISAEQKEGLPDAGVDSTDRFVAGALAFTQKLRNEFLAVSANGRTLLKEYNGTDALPKRIMRAAAMAARATGRSRGPGAEHDLQEGLDILTNILYAWRDQAPIYKSLQDLVSVRRRARGQVRAVDPSDQLLLAEIIYDLVTGMSPPSAERSAGSDPSPAERTKGDVDRAAGGVDRVSPAREEAPVAEGVQRVESPVSQPDPVAPPGEPGAVERFGSSTAFFAERFASAFPGVRSIAWFSDPDEIEQRMLALLKSPLAFPDGLPVWYWRGGNLHIDSFRKIDSGLYLMGADELRISRIAAVHGSSYQRNFVYVQCDAMASTGLYRIGSSDRAGAIEQNGYDYEEYGLVSGKTPITRSQYDDGAAVIDGKLTDISGKSELRVRYTTAYNFVIAANGSPINNPRFDDMLVQQLNVALTEDAEEAIQRLSAMVEDLPLRGIPNA